jgi:hypothetical protein
MNIEVSKWAYATTTECPSHEPLNVPEDVYPFHTLDDWRIIRSIVTWTLCFNDVLDPDILHDALSRLLEIGDWRKLGGRLRFKVWRRYAILAKSARAVDSRYLGKWKA